jgi:hypothetical protein
MEDRPSIGSSYWILLVVIAAIVLIIGVFAALYPVGAGAFLGSADFSGSFDPGPSALPAFGGKSTYDGAVVFTNLDRALVAATLPVDLRLAQNTSSTPDRHPVVFIISHHANMSFLVPGPNPAYPPEYQELILLIPFVQHANGTKWHTLVERMYLDDLAAITLGNLYFGYRKEIGAFVRSDTDLAPTQFEARHLGTPYFEASLSLDGGWRTSGDAETSIQSFTKMQEIFEMPLIGRNPGVAPLLPYLCSYWQWDYSAAFVRPMKSRHRLLRPFSVGTSAWVGLGELKSVKDGAVAMRGMEFRIGLPGFGCQF